MGEEGTGHHAGDAALSRREYFELYFDSGCTFFHLILHGMLYRLLPVSLRIERISEFATGERTKQQPFLFPPPPLASWLQTSASDSYDRPLAFCDSPVSKETRLIMAFKSTSTVLVRPILPLDDQAVLDLARSTLIAILPSSRAANLPRRRDSLDLEITDNSLERRRAGLEHRQQVLQRSNSISAV